MNTYRTATAAAALCAVLIAGMLSAPSAKGHERTGRQSGQGTTVRHEEHQDTRKTVVVRHEPAPQQVVVRHEPAPRREVVVRREPRRVVYRSLPYGYRSVRVANRPYYYVNGAYYTHCTGGYEVVSAPRIRHLPRHARRMTVNQRTYYVCDNVYYTTCGDWYEICEAPHVDTRIILNAGPLTVVLSDHNDY